MRILVLHGPNLNLLGRREPHIYGKETLADVNARLEALARELGTELLIVQSNHEGDLVDAIHGARGRCAAVIVNAGALTHSSYALAGALAAYDGVKVELHVSNPSARETWRHLSVVAPYVTGTVAGTKDG